MGIPLRPLASLSVFVVVLAGISVFVHWGTPSRLVASAERPNDGYGNPGVRTEAIAYPRHATGADDVRMRMDGPAHRIVSQFSSADEYVYSVVPADRVVGVSEMAYRRPVSNVYEL